MSQEVEIYNGAKCKSYRWSQSYSDIEIRIKLRQVVRYENVDVTIDSKGIKVTLFSYKKTSEPQSAIRELESPSNKVNETAEILMEGKFQHPVDTESVFWLLDKDEPCIVIYIDKADDLWWKELLMNEEVTEMGPRNYTILMDHMDDGSRMAIDKLIVEQRNKLAKRASDHYYLS